MTKKQIRNISFVILVVILSLIIIKQEITKRIEKKVIENMSSSRDYDLITREIKRLDLAIKLNPREYKYYFIRGELNCRIKKYNIALNDLNKLRRFKDDFAEGYKFQGMIYDWIGELDSAKICYQKALDILKSRSINESNSVLALDHQRKILLLLFLQNDSLSLRKSLADSTLVKVDMINGILGKSKIEILKERFNN